MAQRNLKGTVGGPLAPDLGKTALNLVYQAAEVLSSIEDHAREAEARAYSICKSAAEGLNLAEKRIEAAECARREADCKLLETSKALKQALSRVEAAEDKLTALEFRAQAAETEAREAKKALALIEEAIRTRLLHASPEDESSLGESERNSVSTGRLSV
jgi:hypothetical protein